MMLLFVLSDTENETVLVLTNTRMKDHLEGPVSKNHRNQMSWNTVFGPIVPARLADMKTMNLLRKRTKRLFPVWFSASAGIWIFNPFCSQSSFKKVHCQSLCFYYLFCNYLHLSEILTDELQSHDVLVQSNA